MKNIDPKKLKECLEEKLNRPAHEHEIINAKTDALLLIEVLFHEIDEIKNKLRI